MKFFLISFLIDKSNNKAFKDEFMANYGPSKATRAVYDRNADGLLVIGFDNSPGAGPIKDGTTDILRIAKLTGGEVGDSDLLIKRQAFTDRVGKLNEKEQAMVGAFFTEVYLAAGTDAIFQAESDNDLDEAFIDHVYTERIGAYQSYNATPRLQDFVCLKDGMVQIYDNGKTGKISCAQLALNLRATNSVFYGTNVVRPIGDAKLMRMPVTDGKQALGYIRKADKVLVILNPDTLGVIDEKLLHGKCVTAGRDNEGKIDDTVIVFGKNAIDVDEYTFERYGAENFFGTDKLKGFAEAMQA